MLVQSSGIRCHPRHGLPVDRWRLGEAKPAEKHADLRRLSIANLLGQRFDAGFGTRIEALHDLYRLLVMGRHVLDETDLSGV